MFSWSGNVALHDGSLPAFVACNTFDRLPHVFAVVGVEVSLQSLLMLSLHLLYASFQFCSGSVVSFFVTGPKGSFFGSI